MRLRFVFVVFAAAISTACASSSGGSAGGGGGSASGSRSRSAGQDVITEADIQSRATDAANALQIIQKLRPQMLRSRGLATIPSPGGRTPAEANDASQPKVYIDNIAYGELGSLSNVNASQIREIRYINARDATTQWGTGHMGGVILVLTRK